MLKEEIILTTKNVQQTTASIVPDISLMKKMASISGTILSRIMELVDNSIDAKIDNQVLNVDIKIDKRGANQSISIIDNGHGMDEEKASRFFRLGDSAKIGRQKIGRFGLGAKVAILGLGNAAKIETSPIGEDYKVEINFDVEQFKQWEIDYLMKKEKKDKHGTKIKIEDITVRLGDVKKLEDRLHEQIGKTYKHFIREGQVVITVNGRKVKPHHVELLEDYYQEFDFEINGKRVHGWAGAMLTAGTNWKFGFDLINHNRIIKSNDLLNRQAHTSLARLTGEIFLDDFQTDIHKTDFMRDNEEFQLMQEYVVEEVLDDLISKIAKLTNKEVFSKYENKMQHLSKVLNKVIKTYDFFQYLELNEETFSFLSKGSRKKSDEDKLKAAYQAVPAEIEEEEKPEADKEEKKERNKNKNPKVGFVVEEPVFVSMGQENGSKQWDVEEQEDGLHLKIEINLDHATYQNEEEAEAFIKNSIIDSIAEFIVKEEKKHDSEFEDEIDRLNTIRDTIFRYSFVK